MSKEWVKVESIGHAVTRICPLPGTLIRELFPLATKDTELEAKRSIVSHEGRQGIFIELREVKKEPEVAQNP